MTLASVSRYDPHAVSGIGEHAVVVGSSVAGLVTARILADGYAKVTICEKDPLPATPESRPGVPQGSHIHALLEAGRATLEDIFPGFSETLLAAGGLMLDGSTDLTYYEEGGVLADGPRRIPLYSASRPLFEHVIRGLVTERENVELRSDCHVTGYLEGDEAVTGIEMREDGGSTREVPADLVIDATGRTSRTPQWLNERGYPSPRVEEVDIDIGYSTVAIERPPDARRAILGVASAPHTRGAAVFPIENERWLLNVHGVHGDHPPTDLDGLRSFAGSLHVEEIAPLLETHSVVSESADFYPFPSNRRRYYEELETFPDGLVVIGDAIASFNPIYGQGMSVSALEALSLHHCLAAGGSEDLARRFFDEIGDIVENAWMMAVGADFQFAETTGPKPRGTDVFARYLSRLMRRAQHDSRLRDELFRVINMERPPTSLLRPGTVWRVLKPRRSTTSGNVAFEESGGLAGE